MNGKTAKVKSSSLSGMQEKLKNFPGIDLNFSQPISDNVEEAVSGVKGSIVVKLFGNDYHFIENKEDTINDIFKNR